MVMQGNVQCTTCSLALTCNTVHTYMYMYINMCTYSCISGAHTHVQLYMYMHIHVHVHVQEKYSVAPMHINLQVVLNLADSNCDQYQRMIPECIHVHVHVHNIHDVNQCFLPKLSPEWIVGMGFSQ